MTGGQYKRLRLLQKNPEKATTLETAALEAGRDRKQRRSLQIGACSMLDSQRRNQNVRESAAYSEPYRAAGRGGRHALARCAGKCAGEVALWIPTGRAGHRSRSDDARSTFAGQRALARSIR